MVLLLQPRQVPEQLQVQVQVQVLLPVSAVPVSLQPEVPDVQELVPVPVSVQRVRLLERPVPEREPVQIFLILFQRAEVIV